LTGASRSRSVAPVSGRLVLIGGGVRCGKSAFALQRARELGSERRVFIATAQGFDGEMRERIRAHQLERGALFETFEEPLALPETLRAHSTSGALVVVDCLTLWLSNLLLAAASDAQIAERVAELARVLRERLCHTILVTNEVGMGVVPDSALGRVFRDVTGFAHQRLAAVAGELYFAALGVIVRLRPEPIAIETAGITAGIPGPGDDTP
jgi:adenosylcobinamide kinase/adenosylcobinamide-phosphate guanylyltransferase